MRTNILKIIEQSLEVKQSLLKSPVLIARIEQAVKMCMEVFKNDGKLLFCGNGGSAADAQHLAAEFSGRFYKNREPLFAEALHVNTSYLTAVANDYGYDEVFARMVKAAGRKGDLLFAISTSGNSPSILKAAETARETGLKVIAMTGSTGGKLASHCDLLLNMPSDVTPRIQEAHILTGHIICELVEAGLFSD